MSKPKVTTKKVDDRTSVVRVNGKETDLFVYHQPMGFGWSVQQGPDGEWGRNWVMDATTKADCVRAISIICGATGASQ